MLSHLAHLDHRQVSTFGLAHKLVMTARLALVIRRCHCDRVCRLILVVLAPVMTLVEGYFDLRGGAFGAVALGHDEFANTLRSWFLPARLILLESGLVLRHLRLIS